MAYAKELAKSIGSTLGSQAATAVIGLAFFAYFGRVLPKSDMAVFAFLVTFTNTLALVSGLGLATLAIREVPTLVAQGNHHEVRQLVSSTMLYCTTVAATAAVLLVGAAPAISRWVFDSPHYAPELRVLAIVAFVQASLSTLSLLQNALQRFHMRAFCMTLNDLASRAFSLVGYVVFGFRGFVIGFGVGAALASAVHVWSMRREFCTSFVSLRVLIGRSKCFIWSDWLRNLLNTADRPLIGFLLGDVAVANYHVAKRLYDLAASAINSATLPVGAKLSEIKIQGVAALTTYFRKSLYLIATMFVPFGALMMAMPESLLWILAGEKYVEGAMILRCFGLSLVLQSTCPMWRQAVLRLLEPRYLVYFTMLLSVVTFGLYGVLLPAMGPKGIPLSYGCACVAATCWAAFAIRRRVGMTCGLHVYARPLLCGALVFGGTLLASRLERSVTSTVVCLLVGCGCFAIGLVFLAPPEVRAMVGRLTKRLKLTLG